MTVPPFQDIATLAANLCVHPRTITKWVEDKKFPQPIRLNGRVLWDWRKVERYITGKSQDVGQTEAEKLECITNATRTATERRARG